MYSPLILVEDLTGCIKVQLLLLYGILGSDSVQVSQLIHFLYHLIVYININLTNHDKICIPIHAKLKKMTLVAEKVNLTLTVLT